MSRAFAPHDVVVITGATSGNGRAAAVEFAKAGARLVLAGRRRTALDEVIADCARRGAEAIGLVVDVGNGAQVESLADAALARFGALDVWINNAGVLQYGRFDETPAGLVDALIRTNLTGCLNGSRTALRCFRRQGHGVLINTSSILGLVGHGYTAAYVASKFAIRGLTQSLRQEMRDTPGVQVCAVLPAAIDTPIYQRAANYMRREIQPIRPIYPPETVGRAMLDVARRPRRQVYAGGFGLLIGLGERLAPRLTEEVVRTAAGLLEFTRRPSPHSEGNVRTAVEDGWRTDGGWRRRYGPSGDGRVWLGAALAAALGIGLAMRANRQTPDPPGRDLKRLFDVKRP